MRTKCISISRALFEVSSFEEMFFLSCFSSCFIIIIFLLMQIPSVWVISITKKIKANRLSVCYVYTNLFSLNYTEIYSDRTSQWRDHNNCTLQLPKYVDLIQTEVSMRQRIQYEESLLSSWFLIIREKKAEQSGRNAHAMKKQTKIGGHWILERDNFLINYEICCSGGAVYYK